MSSSASALSVAQQAAQSNMLARQMVLASGQDMLQKIFSSTFNPQNGNVINVVPRNVGLIKGFFVELVATVTNTAGAATLLSDFNAANLLSQIIFTDFQNQVRINTTGWHLEMLNTARRMRVFGSSVATDSPVKYGSNWQPISATASIAASGTGTVKMIYWVPLSFNHSDLRGAVYAGVTNSTANLQLTINPAPSPAAGDSTSSVYVGNAATITNVVLTVYQSFIDQLPQGSNGAILPAQDLSTIYEIKNTNFVGLVQNNDFPMQFANFRDFLSQFVVYYNGSARTAGTDVNYLSLLSANTTQIFNVDPQLHSLRTRNTIGTDFPNGVYWFDFQRKPISTLQYGNMQLVLNPSTVNAGAYIYAGYEAFAYMNSLSSAGSLAS